MRRAMVVGAAEGSLGEALILKGREFGWEMISAGPNGNEDVYFNALVEEDDETLLSAFHAWDIDTVFCTIGVNEPAVDGSLAQVDFDAWMARSFAVNAIAPMRLLRMFNMHLSSTLRDHGVFVAVSSNSAHIARSNSMAYCASKAALSMAIRVAAREGKGHPSIVYGYELGLLRGTPMTRATEARFGPSQTRMPGAPAGLNAQQVAAQIVAQAGVGGQALNGSLLRLDAGEQ